MSLFSKFGDLQQHAEDTLSESDKTINKINTVVPYIKALIVVLILILLFLTFLAGFLILKTQQKTLNVSRLL